MCAVAQNIVYCRKNMVDAVGVHAFEDLLENSQAILLDPRPAGISNPPPPRAFNMHLYISRYASRLQGSSAPLTKHPSSPTKRSTGSSVPDF